MYQVSNRTTVEEERNDFATASDAADYIEFKVGEIIAQGASEELRPRIRNDYIVVEKDAQGEVINKWSGNDFVKSQSS